MTDQQSDQVHAPRRAVVYITDGDTGDQMRLVWSLRSLLRHAPSGYDVVVLSPCNEIRGIQASLARDLGGVSFSTVGDMAGVLGDVGISDSGWNRQWPFVVLYRLGIPLHPAFAQYDSVLYLDTDTLVLSDRIVDFMQADLAGFEAGGVPDTAQEAYDRTRVVLQDDLSPEHATAITGAHGMSFCTRSYINAGVLLLNLSEIRRDTAWYRRRLEMFWESECRGGFGFLDQDFVNAMMKVRSDFSLVFNWFNVCGYESDKCVVRHYAARRYGDMMKRVVAEGLM